MDKLPTDLVWARSPLVGWFASSSLGDDTQKKWVAAETQGRVIFKAENGQVITMPISFWGDEGSFKGIGEREIVHRPSVRPGETPLLWLVVPPRVFRKISVEQEILDQCIL